MANQNIRNGVQGNWQVSANDGSQIQFTSFMSMEFIDNAKVVEESIEKGTFTSYNKTESSGEAYIVLGLTYDDGADIPATLDLMARWKSEPILLTIITPEHVLENYTLERWTYNRIKEDGVGVLFVEIQVREIRENGDTSLAGGGLRTSQVRNPSNASAQQRGTIGAKPNQSLLKYMGM